MQEEGGLTAIHALCNPGKEKPGEDVALMKRQHTYALESSSLRTHQLISPMSLMPQPGLHPKR